MSDDPLKESGMHHYARARIFKNAASLRKNQTRHEEKLWNYLRLKPNGYKIRRQHPIGSYILDFYCHRKKISIEIDGYSHNSAIQKEYDRKRTDYLNKLGIHEMRFTNSEVDENFDNVIQTIIQQLEK